jgi:transcriptional regulator with XRE-family HTH domain
VRSSEDDRFYRQLIGGLVDARTAADLSQTDLAKRLGRPQSFVSKYERLERRLDLAELLSVSKILGFDYEHYLRAWFDGIR